MSDWSSDVCSSDLTVGRRRVPHADAAPIADGGRPVRQERRRYICERARDVRHRYRYGAGPRLPLHSAREYVRILDGDRYYQAVRRRTAEDSAAAGHTAWTGADVEP